MYKLPLAIALALLAGQASAATLYSNDFDGHETVGAGVAVSALTNGGLELATTFGAWTGHYFANRSSGIPAAMSTLTLQNLAPHTQVSAGFILGFLESWDGNDNDSFAPDNLDVFIDGVKVATFTSNNSHGNEVYGGGTIIAHHVQANDNLYYIDTLVDMSTAPVMTFAHTGATLTLSLQASGTGWQGGSDEAWGIDALHITYDAAPVPEPATWALMGAGIALTGLALRRRKRQRD